MNIFATDESPIISALNLDDRRVIKMITESAQMISSAVNLKVGKGQVVPKMFKTSFINHPCTVWTRESRQNLIWLYQHAKKMGEIYSDVYKRDHSSMRVIREVPKHFDKFPAKGLTPFADCTEFKDEDWDIYTKYKNFMILKWDVRDPVQNLTPTWQLRPKPFFYNKG